MQWPVTTYTHLFSCIDRWNMNNMRPYLFGFYFHPCVLIENFFLWIFGHLSAVHISNIKTGISIRTLDAQITNVRPLIILSMCVINVVVFTSKMIKTIKILMNLSDSGFNSYRKFDYWEHQFEWNVVIWTVENELISFKRKKICRPIEL